MAKTFDSIDLRTVPPITFDLADESFAVPRKQRHDIMVMVTQNLITLSDGTKQVRADACRQAILLFLQDERWDPEALVFDAEGMPVWEDVEVGQDPVQKRGAWVPADDKDRWLRLTKGGRVAIADQTFGDILDYITTEVTAHPTGAPS